MTTKLSSTVVPEPSQTFTLAGADQKTLIIIQVLEGDAKKQI